MDGVWMLKTPACTGWRRMNGLHRMPAYMRSGFLVDDWVDSDRKLDELGRPVHGSTQYCRHSSSDVGNESADPLLSVTIFLVD
jgi:hypothetical protein